jgi:hypothetical protein
MALEQKTKKLFLGIKKWKHTDLSQPNAFGRLAPFKSDYGFYALNPVNEHSTVYRNIRQMALNIAKHFGADYKDKVTFEPSSDSLHELSQKNKSDLNVLVDQYLESGDFMYSHGDLLVYKLE